MFKFCRRVWFCILLVILVLFGTLIADRQMLREELVRFHVVAASDAFADQALKLQVRDAVMDNLAEAMAGIRNAEQAADWLKKNLERIETVANDTLRRAGCCDRAVVRFETETFDAVENESLSLPAGVYRTLRITIGKGEGKNWWCVIFPVSADEADVVAAWSGFPDSLRDALRGDGYEVRFYLLDLLGRLENFLWGG